MSKVSKPLLLLLLLLYSAHSSQHTRFSARLCSILAFNNHAWSPVGFVRGGRERERFHDNILNPMMMMAFIYATAAARIVCILHHRADSHSMRRKRWRGWSWEGMVGSCSFCYKFDRTNTRPSSNLYKAHTILAFHRFTFKAQIILACYQFCFKNSPILPSIHFASTSLFPPPAACPHTLSITANSPLPNNPTSTSLSSTAKY